MQMTCLKLQSTKNEGFRPKSNLCYLAKTKITTKYRYIETILLKTVLSKLVISCQYLDYKII